MYHVILSNEVIRQLAEDIYDQLILDTKAAQEQESQQSTETEKGGAEQ